MWGNSFGIRYKLTTFGESHGNGIGVVIDGFPANFPIDLTQIQYELNRRRPGQSAVTTARNEADKLEVLSGIFEGKSTGAPIAFLVRNKDHQSKDYDAFKDIYRPSHADYTYQIKYGMRDYRGGGRQSARETLARVIAGALAKQFLGTKSIYIYAFVSKIHQVSLDKPIEELDLTTIENNIVRCPDEATAQKMIEAIETARVQGDSLGGVITCVIPNMPVGLGEPVFDKLSARLAFAMCGINAVKGFEMGDGFKLTDLKGSQANDEFYLQNGEIKTKSNRSGGVLGGISNGNALWFRTAFKPTASINKEQSTVDVTGNEVNVSINGRHDPCVLPRAVPIVEAMAACVLLDFCLLSGLD